MWVSARTGAGIEELAGALGERFEARGPSRKLRLTPGSGRMRARLYALGAVLGERPCDDGGSIVEVRIAERDFDRLKAEAGRSFPKEVEAPEAGGARGAVDARKRSRVRAS